MGLNGQDNSKEYKWGNEMRDFRVKIGYSHRRFSSDEGVKDEGCRAINGDVDAG